MRLADDSIPEALLQNTSSIAAMAGNQEAIRFVPGTWHLWAKQIPGEAATAIDAMAERHGATGITREHLRKLATTGSDLELFSAALMWGRGKRNGRMRDAIINTFKELDGSDVLASTRAAASAGDPGAAYAAWSLSRGIREAFFTKWLWAASLGEKNVGRRPLILDSRVWLGLAQLRWDSRHAAGSRSRPKRYAAYVDVSHRWADALGAQTGMAITAEDVECALFVSGRRGAAAGFSLT